MHLVPDVIMIEASTAILQNLDDVDVMIYCRRNQSIDIDNSAVSKLRFQSISDFFVFNMSRDLTSVQVGGYMPKETLAQLSREVRNTHFKLGGSEPQYDTAHKQQFKPQAPVKIIPLPPPHTREAHFAFGQDHGSMSTETEMTARYKAHSIENHHVLSQESKNELRRHHFGLGSDQPTYMTMHKETYVPKVRDLNISLDSAMRIKNVRKAHFQLGNDDSVLLSVAKTDFTPKTVEKIEEEKYLAEMRKDLRVSHFQVGNTPLNFVSTAKEDYIGTQGKSAALNAQQKDELRREHFVLGTMKPDMTSTAQNSYTAKRDGRQELGVEKLHDLHSSHFVLGKAEGNYQPTSHLAHKGFGPVSAPHVQDSKTLRQSHLVLGSDQNVWKTVYSSTHQEREAQSAHLSDGAAKARTSHFVLGSEHAVGQSTNHGDYQRSGSAQPNRLSPEDEKSLRGHHFQLGMDPSNRFATSYKMYGASGGQASVMDPARKKDLQSTHFQYGTEQQSYETSHGHYYAKKGSESLSPERVKNTRKSNFELGTKNGGAWSTTYKGNYNWIQPVPDMSYKFQIQQ